MSEVVLKVSTSVCKRDGYTKVAFRIPGESNNLSALEIASMLQDATIVVLRLQKSFKGDDIQAKALKLIREKGLPLHASVRFE